MRKDLEFSKSFFDDFDIKIKCAIVGLKGGNIHMITKIEIDDDSYICEDFHKSSLIKTITYSCIGKTAKVRYEVDFKIYYSPDDNTDKFSVVWLKQEESFDSLEQAKSFIFTKISEVKEKIDLEQDLMKEFRSWNFKDVRNGDDERDNNN